MNDDATEVQRQDRLQEILLSYVEAAEAGASPQRDQFIAAHPEFADDIREFLAGYHQLNRLASPSNAGGMRHGAMSKIEAVIRHDRADNRPTESLGSSPDSAPGDLGQLGDYRLLREIGRGGMGVVYEAEQISLRRRIALKILPLLGVADSRQLQRFRNEAQAAAHLHHSHIVPVFAIGSERGVHYYAMQYIEGQSLATLIDALTDAQESLGGERSGTDAKNKAIAGSTIACTISTDHSSRSRRFFRTAATIAKQTAEALEYAHQTGIIHRDIKPGNLLLDSRGEVWITDFGLAQFQSQGTLTVTGELVGTLRYMSPEQAMAKRGLVDHRTDIYSLGATLYEYLTLKPVFDGKDRQTLLRQIDFDEPIPLREVDPAIPVELETIVLKAVSKLPSERYASAGDLAEDLQRFLDDKPIQAKRPTHVERARKWMRRHPSVVRATAVMLVFALIAFATSTILIAREQLRTQTAYDRLNLEEKQTKAAYEALEIEQGRTSEAYAVAAKQRDLAERDFAQAQRSLELVVQFSEGELAHHPGQEDVRRRLLLTVLDYYEDFLAVHADDPAIQAELTASRERVASILKELSNLRGSTLLAIIQDAEVQKDLGLAAEQQSQIAQRVDAEFKPKGKSAAFNRSAAAVERMVNEVLDSAQKQRFQQIVLQVQQQGRYGFSDPKIVEALKLTNKQRERIRKIQNETHRRWADHLFTDRKIGKPKDFWHGVQEQILAVLDGEQRDQWQELAGTPIMMELREGYPWDGRNVVVPKPRPSFHFPGLTPGEISVMHLGVEDFVGSGFGHRVHLDDKQAYSWRGKEIPPTVFEIAVTADALTEEERRHLLANNVPLKDMPVSGAPRGWMVLFRSSDPSVWNTDSPGESRFAVPVSRADGRIRYLRLKRMDTGDSVIVSISRDNLVACPKPTSELPYVWNGSAEEAFGGRHLGIAEWQDRSNSRRRDPRNTKQ